MENNKKVISLGILLSILFLISAAYAWLRISVESDVEHVIHAGKLDLILDDEASNGIHMENVVPTSDTKGREQDGYQFKLINRGTISSRYTLYLDDLSLESGAKRMQDSVVKYSLERDGVELSSGLLNEMGTNPNRILDTGVINKKTTYTYLLKVWMDQDATMENQGTIFYTKIRAEAEQTNMPVKKSEMELTPESVEKVPIKDGEDPKKYTYTSSDWNVVKVDEEGNIEVIGPGYAVITKTDPYGEKEEITVHVTVPVEATFETNDKIESIGTITNNTCNLTENKQTTCQISLPEVVVKDGYEFVGWSTEENSHDGKKENILISSEKNILYPIIKKSGEELTITFKNEGHGVKSIGSESLTCKVGDSYNDATGETSCKITLPEIQAEDGYTVIGWSTEKTAHEGIAPGSEVDIIIGGIHTYYPIVKKEEVSLTATFLLNGAKSLNGLNASELEPGGKLNLTCTIPESYSGETKKTSCSINVPIIEASDATPNVIGFNEDITAIVSSISDKITISENKTYYALTKSDTKTYTATFHRNGATKIDHKNVDSVTKNCNIGSTYNGQPQEESCSITTPSIEASSNTPNILGFSTGEGLHEEDTTYVNPEREVSLTGNVSYYAQTANNENIAYTATYQKGSHVVSIEKEQDVCHIAPSYNGEKRATSCTIIPPDYIVDSEYKKVGYSENKDALDGVMKITLNQNMTYYANASKVSKTIEYYTDGLLVGTSTADSTDNITLRDFEDLNITKTGYHFKGWDTKETASDIVYSDGARIEDLTEGEIRKLYAVWIDDIPPKCVFTGIQDSYSVGNRLPITVTCTDEGSGFAGRPGDMIMPQSNNVHFENYSGQDSTSISFAFEPQSLSTGMCAYSENKDTMICNMMINAICVTDNGIAKVREGTVSDVAGNKNEEVATNSIKIEPLTFSATLTSTDVDGVESGSSTRRSCTTIGPYNSCDVNLDNINLKEGYRWAGWSADKTAKAGEMSIGLKNDVTLFPLVAPIFIDAYTYNETVDASNYCVTGEESTCQKSTCYEDDVNDACPSGTIFRYAVKSDTPETHHVNSLDDYVYYFHVVHDDGDKLTLQTRENLRNRTNPDSYIYSDWNSLTEGVTDGPTLSIQLVEENTNDWNYVNTIKYTMGVTPFLGNSNTGCNYGLTCDTNTYTWNERSAKARLITVQEATNLNCIMSQQTCPIWMYNYLKDCHSFGCTKEESPIENYATMNAASFEVNNPGWVWMIYKEGRLSYNSHHELLRGVRPVIEINKSSFRKSKDN